MQPTSQTTATAIYKTTGTTKQQINYNELKTISYFMLRISHYLHNTYQSTPWDAENNYSKVSNIEGRSLPACMQRGIMYSVQWVFKTEEKRASFEEQHMKSNDNVISIDMSLKIWVKIFWHDSAPLAVHSLCRNCLNFHFHVTYYTFYLQHSVLSIPKHHPPITSYKDKIFICDSHVII